MQRFIKTLAADRQGFTIIEFVVIIVITGIIAGITATLLLQVTKIYSFATVREAILSDGELAMGRMIREIRQIKDNQSIYTADEQEIDFEIDFEGADERIRFWLDGDILMRNNDGLASDVTELEFQYRDKDNNLLSTPVASPEVIKRILLEFSIERGDEKVTLRSQVYPRSL